MDQTLCQSCARTFKAICGVIKHKEMFIPLGFYFIQGILLPNLDDLHYVFLTSKVGMAKSTYDFLNMLTYIGCVFFIFLYKTFL